MGSPSTIITLGYGAFGDVNLLPTLGFGIGAAIIPDGGIFLFDDGLFMTSVF